jgi:hypothetical protein
MKILFQPAIKTNIFMYLEIVFILDFCILFTKIIVALRILLRYLTFTFNTYIIFIFIIIFRTLLNTLKKKIKKNKF